MYRLPDDDLDVVVLANVGFADLDKVANRLAKAVTQPAARHHDRPGAPSVAPSPSGGRPDRHRARRMRASRYPPRMRIATWNVNSLKARMDAVERWLERARPDVLLMQETKLSDEDAPLMPFQLAGYDLLHHGEGRWNGVAIASRVGISEPVTNFGDGPVRDSRSGADVGCVGGGLRPVRRGADGVRGVWRHPGRVHLRAQWSGGRFTLLPGQAALVRAPGRVGGRHGGDRIQPRHRWRLQRRPDGRRRVVAPCGTRRHPCLGAGARRTRAPARRGSQRRLPRSRGGARPFLVVGLPRGHVPQEPGHAHRPAVRDARTWRAGSSGWRSTARRARVHRRRPTTRPWSSTWTQPAVPFDAGWVGAMSRVAARTKPASSA